MYTFQDLKYMYSHPRIRVLQGKAIASLDVDWNNIKTIVKHDYKNPKSKAKTEYMSMYRDDLKKYMDQNPNTMVKVYLPKSISMILQTIIEEFSDENTVCRVRNDYDYNILTMVKQKKTFDDNFVSSATQADGRTFKPAYRSTLRRLLQDNFGITDLEEYRDYCILSTDGVHRKSDVVELTPEQLSALRQLCLYKRANYVQIPINTNRTKLMSFINIGELLWGK